MTQTLNQEIKRLVRLQQRNPNIKQTEIDYLTETVDIAHQCITSARLKLDAVRLIITS